jgi:hypothetical protein
LRRREGYELGRRRTRLRRDSVVTAPTVAPATPSFFKQFDPLPEPSQTVLIGGQTPNIHLRPTITGYTYRERPTAERQVFALVDLNDTTLSPGRLTWNKDDKRGWFTDRIEVRMGFEDDPNLLVRSDAPQTTAVNGSISSGTSDSYSIGLFGETPTGNIGGSISAGVSQSVPDFEIINTSGDTEPPVTAIHTYRLRLADGAGYHHPPDLVDTSYPGLGSVRALPPRATSNFPIVSSALFKSSVNIEATRRLAIEVDHRIVRVEKTYKPVLHIGLLAAKEVRYDPKRENEPQRTQFLTGGGIGMVAIDTSAMVLTYRYVFSVDFRNNGVTFDG